MNSIVPFDYRILAVFIAYFAVLVGIAVFRARQMEDMSDYVLGGRKMGPLTSALSSASSAASGWTMLVFPALVFAAGLIHVRRTRSRTGPGKGPRIGAGSQPHRPYRKSPNGDWPPLRQAQGRRQPNCPNPSGFLPRTPIRGRLFAGITMASVKAT